MIKGNPKEMLLPPVANKNIDEKECFVPFNIDIRNGVFTDVKYWKKRNGYSSAASLTDSSWSFTTTFTYTGGPVE